jgi:hypothetical protein
MPHMRATKEIVMTPTRTLMACLLALGSIGCQAQKPPPPDHDFKSNKPVREGDRVMNSSMVQDYYQRQVSAGIIREQTLYPYHFIVNGSGLNALGRRDLYVLTEHYLVNPGNLKIRHGEESKEIYDARVKMVVDAMTSAGVRMDRVKVTDGLPGGDGVSSDRVVLILEKFQEPGALAEDSGASAGSSSSDASDNSIGDQGIGSGSGTGSAMSNTGGN